MEPLIFPQKASVLYTLGPLHYLSDMGLFICDIWHMVPSPTRVSIYAPNGPPLVDKTCPLAPQTRMGALNESRKQ